MVVNFMCDVMRFVPSIVSGFPEACELFAQHPLCIFLMKLWVVQHQARNTCTC